MSHVPVLLESVLKEVAPKKGESVLDCTLGLGGHASAFLKEVGTKGHLIGLDADAKNLETARKKISAKNASFIHANFRELPECLPPHHRAFDIVFADLGLSSPHLDDASRGFTFREEAPLDMRYDQTQGKTAGDILHKMDEHDLKMLFIHFGELPLSHMLARNVVKARRAGKLRTSKDLSIIVDETYGHTAKHRIAQVFQALRIAVNDELTVLGALLAAGPNMLKVHGRMAIITYHSLEDRLVKTIFRALSTPPKDPVTGQDLSEPEFTILTKRPITPDDGEISANPRARSAKLRILRRDSAVSL